MSVSDAPPPVVSWPTVGVDGRVALATALHSAPGVYAVLVGSGMSSAAGVPTGWQVVQDLIRKIALAEGVDPAEVEDEPQLWWAKQGRTEPRYDTLLGALAPTDAARQALLRRYFETGQDGNAQVVPTVGHHVLARLVAAGRIRVIITTNFDRLIERSLDQAGIPPQVVSRPSDIAGMTPLPHADITVVKVHGDYLSLGLRNTPDELGSYPQEQQDLLARIFDEYGLIVVGWSADYDTALSDALLQAPSRRYPTFWTTFNGDKSETATRLIATRNACVIDTGGADEFFDDLVQKVSNLDRVAQRRGRPTLLSTYFLPPETSVAPEGWAVLPLLQLRAAAAVGPASQESCGLLRAENRERLVDALRNAPLTHQIRMFSGYPAEWAVTPSDDREPTPAPLGDWGAEHGYQSTAFCTYRLGGDATAGVSMLVTVRFPGYGAQGQVSITADLALSLKTRLFLGGAAALLRDGLVLVTSMIPEALEDIFPGDAQVMSGEVHFLAPTMFGNATQGNRQNDIADRIDLSSLGNLPTRPIGQQMGCAARISDPLTARDAAELVCEAIDYMTYAVGFLDPRLGIRQLRQELGVPETALD